MSEPGGGLVVAEKITQWQCILSGIELARPQRLSAQVHGAMLPICVIVVDIISTMCVVCGVCLCACVLCAGGLDAVVSGTAGPWTS